MKITSPFSLPFPFLNHPNPNGKKVNDEKEIRALPIAQPNEVHRPGLRLSESCHERARLPASRHEPRHQWPIPDMSRNGRICIPLGMHHP